MLPCSEDAYHVVYQGSAMKVQTVIGKNMDGSTRHSTMFSVKNPDQVFILTGSGKSFMTRETFKRIFHDQQYLPESFTVKMAHQSSTHVGMVR